MNRNFGQTNPRSPLGFISTCICASILIYFGVVFLCVQELKIYLILPVKASHQVEFVLEVKEMNTLIFVQVRLEIGLTG